MLFITHLRPEHQVSLFLFFLTTKGTVLLSMHQVRLQLFPSVWNWNSYTAGRSGNLTLLPRLSSGPYKRIHFSNTVLLLLPMLELMAPLSLSLNQLCAPRISTCTSYFINHTQYTFTKISAQKVSRQIYQPLDKSLDCCIVLHICFL